MYVLYVYVARFDVTKKLEFFFGNYYYTGLKRVVCNSLKLKLSFKPRASPHLLAYPLYMKPRASHLLIAILPTVNTS